MKQPQCTPCHGTNPKTGMSVGTLHRWSQNGICDFCGRSYSAVHPGKIFAPVGKVKFPRAIGKTPPSYHGL
jgi:hypothetical protein